MGVSSARQTAAQVHELGACLPTRAWKVLHVGLKPGIAGCQMGSLGPEASPRLLRRRTESAEGCSLEGPGLRPKAPVLQKHSRGGRRRQSARCQRSSLLGSPLPATRSSSKELGRSPSSVVRGPRNCWVTLSWNSVCSEESGGQNPKLCVGI